MADGRADKNDDAIARREATKDFLASEAMTYGYGGISKASRISGVSIPTIRQGIKEIQTGQAIENGRIRKAGGGRKRVEDIYPEIWEKIKEIVDGNTYGSPEKVLSWTTLSLHDIQRLLLEKYRDCPRICVNLHSGVE